MKQQNHKNIWQKLSDSGPIVALAPMDDVTDVVFRQLVHEIAPADLYFTEFANADGFCSPGRPAIEKRLRLGESEGPVIAQIWGIQPTNFRLMAAELAKRDFVGIDLNMGCPVKDIIKKGACSALIQNHDLAHDIIIATQAGANGLPVSVKTRLGVKDVDWDWLEFLLGHNLAALTIHLRTVSQLSKVPANWEIMKDIIKLRDRIAPNTLILGNGDVSDRPAADALAELTGCDGVMIGRGIFHNPWAFEKGNHRHTPAERIACLNRHLNLWENIVPIDHQARRFEPLKRFFKIYISDYDGASKLRAELMACHEINQVKLILKSLLKNPESA